MLSLLKKRKRRGYLMSNEYTMKTVIKEDIEGTINFFKGLLTSIIQLLTPKMTYNCITYDSTFAIIIMVRMGVIMFSYIPFMAPNSPMLIFNLIMYYLIILSIYERYRRKILGNDWNLRWEDGNKLY